MTQGLAPPVGGDATLNIGRVAGGSLYMLTAGFTFGLLVIGTSAGWLVPEIRALGVISMGILIGWWIFSLSRLLDGIDAATIIVVAAIGVTSTASIIPRLSTDAFYGALAYAAIFGLARRLSPESRTSALKALCLVATVVIALLLIVWGGTWIRWQANTGALPPLSLRLPSVPFGHPHDAALAVGMLLPAITVISTPASRRGLVALGVLAGGAVTVFVMSGGRGVWLAAVVATIAMLAATRRLRLFRNAIRTHWRTLVATAAVLGVAAIASGAAAAVGQRLFTMETVAARSAIWESSLAAWGQRPVTGTGPGTFQFALQSTGYFDTVVYAPKHADNLYVQTLSEIGLVGVIPLIALGLLIGRAWITARPPAACGWAITFAGVAGLTANPAALGYCAILIAFWSGMSVPVTTNMRPVSWLTAVVLAPTIAASILPLWLTTAGAFQFDRARNLALNGDTAGAIKALDGVIRLDPTFPLYHRERGSLLLSAGRGSDALADLRVASTLNQWDDATLRGLSLAALETGHLDEARIAVQHAVDLQQTDPLSQATLAYVADATGDHTIRNRALDALVTLAPWSTGDPVWTAAFSEMAPSAVLSRAATYALEAGLGVDGRWVGALVASDQATDLSVFSTPQRAFSLVVRCKTNEAMAVLDDPAEWDVVDPEYWFARAVVGRLLDRDIGSDAQALSLASLPIRREGSPVDSPLVDESAYVRRPIAVWSGLMLPSNDSGIRAWVDNPEQALARVRHAGWCPKPSRSQE